MLAIHILDMVNTPDIMMKTFPLQPTLDLRRSPGYIGGCSRGKDGIRTYPDSQSRPRKSRLSISPLGRFFQIGIVISCKKISDQVLFWSGEKI
jgi:hypothetical protein